MSEKPASGTSKKKLSLLHIVLPLGETNATYNEHCLPMAQERDISICTYFKPTIVPSPTVTCFEGDGSFVGFFRALKAAIAAKKYDAIHAHSPHVALMALLYLLFTHPKKLSSTVVTVHDSYPNFKLRNRLLFLPVFASFRKVICCSQSSYESFPAFYHWLARGRISFVQNGMDIHRVDRAAQRVLPQTEKTGRFTVVAISRLVDIKNPATVLGAFQQSLDPNSCLIYIGDGVLKKSLLEKRAELGLENQVTFTGLIPREKVYEHLLNANVFMSASRGEGLPIAVLEAMACLRPVILSDIPPHREIARGVDFIPLIDPDDPAGFAREIQKIREMTESERAVIGQKCRRIVEERFSLEAMHAGYQQVYTQVNHQQADR